MSAWSRSMDEVDECAGLTVSYATVLPLLRLSYVFFGYAFVEVRLRHSHEYFGLDGPAHGLGHAYRPNG